MYNLIFFYVPYKFYSSKGGDNGYLIFAKCVLLLFANAGSIFFIYSIINDVSFEFSQLTRGGIKFLTLLALIPFALFYLLNKDKYLRMFKMFSEMQDSERAKWNLMATFYIYGSVMIFFIMPLSYALIKKVM